MMYKLKILQLTLVFIAMAASTYAQRKNVLIIMADDFNYWTSKNGYYPQAKTPNIDALANRGVFFSEAHCASPVCNPSRNALWSGIRPSTSGIDANGKGYIREIIGFEDIITMNQYFKEQGYFTYGSGKLWHPGSMSETNHEVDPENWTSLNPQKTGCNGGDLYSYQMIAKSNYAWGANENEMTEGNCGDYALANDVATLIKNYNSSENRDQPFFIGCGFFRPHMPWKGPQQFWDMFNQDELVPPAAYRISDEPGNNVHQEIVAQGEWQKAIHAYLAMCALADHNVGVVMNALNNSPMKENTIVVFMGDHGWHLGEKGHWGKFSLWDEANHTTLIIYDPSAKGNGKTSTKVVSLQDIYPTLIDLCGLDPKTNIEGQSLSQLLHQPDKTDWDHPILMTYNGINYIKTNRFRFIDDGTKSKLHDNEKDPYQWTNLYGDSSYNSIVSKLREQIDSIINIGSELKCSLLSDAVYRSKEQPFIGTTEAENFDDGSNTQTYLDQTKGNEFDYYRTHNDVDINITDDKEGGFHIEQIENGEWLQYSYNNVEAGVYDFSFRVYKNEGSNSSIELYINNQNLGSVQVNAKDEWQDVQINNVNIDYVPTIRLQIKFNGEQIKFNNFTTIKMENIHGVKYQRKHSMNIIQNPLVNHGVLELDLKDMNASVQIEIYNMAGKSIIKDTLFEETTVLYQIPSIPKGGTYILHIDDGRVKYQEKFVVNK